MKKIFILLAIAIVTLGAQPNRSNFGGKWALDLKKSANLPSSFKSVDSYLIEVQQTPDSLISVATMSGAGQKVSFPQFSIAFDGSETFREDVQRNTKRWSKVQWQTTEKKMIVLTRVLQKRGEKDISYTQRDVWQLLDRNTIEQSITLSYTKPDSTHSERRIFRRIK